MMEQVRLCAVSPMENWLGSSLNQIQGSTTVRESYSHALELSQSPCQVQYRLPYLLRDRDDADRLIGEPGERDLAEPAEDPFDLGDPDGERERRFCDPCDPAGDPDGDRDPDLGGGDLEGEEEEDEDESASAMADVTNRGF